MFPELLLTTIDKVDQLRHDTTDHMQIPRDEAKLLHQIVRIGRFVSAVEIGVSYGFSTLHTASAIRANGGHMHAIDISEKKIHAATKHLTEAGLIDTVTLHLGDARAVLESLKPAQPVDFVFIDAVKEQSSAYLARLEGKLAPRCVICTDNTDTHPEQLADFVAELRSMSGATSCNVPLGNGFELTVIDRA